MGQQTNSGFPELDRIMVDLEFPCAMCSKTFGDHSMEMLKKCFKLVGSQKRELAIRVLAAIANVEERNPEWNTWRTDVTEDVSRLFASEYIDVERSGDAKNQVQS